MKIFCKIKLIRLLIKDKNGIIFLGEYYYGFPNGLSFILRWATSASEGRANNGPWKLSGNYNKNKYYS